MNSSAASKIAVMIVEDDCELREMLCDVLAARGACVFAAENGGAALEALERIEVHCVLSDVRMPGGDGLELLHAIRSRQPSLPFLFLSGYTDLDLERALELGAQGLLAKPVRIEEIVEAIEAACGRRLV